MPPHRWRHLFPFHAREVARAFSSVGQSSRLITGRSWVRVPEGPPYRGIAQLVEQRSPKPRAEGSSPSAPAKYGAVVQLVRTPACHAGGRGFKSLPRRHIFLGALECLKPSQVTRFAAVAQSVERILGKDEVGGSNPPSSSKNSGNFGFRSFLYLREKRPDAFFEASGR